MDKSVFSFVGVIAITLVGGCTTYIEYQASLEFEPIYLEATPQADAVTPTGGIYKASSQGLFATDIRARGVGDILTVALAETFTATKSQSTSSSKSAPGRRRRVAQERLFFAADAPRRHVPPGVRPVFREHRRRPPQLRGVRFGLLRGVLRGDARAAAPPAPEGPRERAA